MWNEVDKEKLEEESIFFPVEHSKQKIEELVESIRLKRYNRELPCGAQVIRDKLEKLCVQPLPSVSTINRILARLCLTNKRTGYYEEEHMPLEKNG